MRTAGTGQDETGERYEERRRRLLGRGQWRTEVEVRCRELANRLAVAITPPGAEERADRHELVEETIEAVSADTRVTVNVEQSRPHPSRPSVSPEVRATHAQAVIEALEDARSAVDSDPSPMAWWTGSAVTMAWESVHDAEGELLWIEPEDVVISCLPRLITWLHEVVADKTLLDRYDKQLTAFVDGTKPLDRTVVRQAQQVATVTNNDRHAELRTFRNLLIALTVALGTVLVGLAIAHSINPHFVSLCGTASGSVQTGPAAQTTQCLTGADPAERDVFEIGIVGAVGGLLSVAFALGSSGTAPSRYNVRAPQAALKPIAGAATAIVGVLLVQSHLLVAPAERVSESVLLAYAAVFGFSQQLLTQFVDKRAGKLLEAESKPAGPA